MKQICKLGRKVENCAIKIKSSELLRCSAPDIYRVSRNESRMQARLSSLREVQRGREKGY